MSDPVAIHHLPQEDLANGAHPCGAHPCLGGDGVVHGAVSQTAHKTLCNLDVATTPRGNATRLPAIRTYCPECQDKLPPEQRTPTHTTR